MCLDRKGTRKLTSYKTNTRLLHYTRTNFIKNILYLVLFLFVFLLFYLFCVEYDIGGSRVLGVQRTKCLVGSELDMAKKIVREKDARCY